MSNEENESRSIRVQFLRLFLSVIGQAHAVSAHTVRLSSSAGSAQIDFCGPDDGNSVLKSLKIKEEYLRPLFELVAERSFQWPDGVDLKSSFLPKKARRVVCSSGGNIRFMFDLSALQTKADGIAYSFDNFQRDKIPDILDQLDLSDANRIAISSALKTKTGIILTSSPLKHGSVEGGAALLACRPDAVLINKVELESEVKEAVLLSKSSLVVVSLAGEDPIQLLSNFVARCRLLPGLGNEAIDRTILALVQRRVRRTCSSCARPTLIDSLTLDKLPALLRPRDVKSYLFGRGCDRCGHAAYRGTVSLESLILVDAGMRKLLAEEAPAEQLVELGYRSGLRSLLEDGLNKIVGGLTSFEEVLAVAPRVNAAYSAAILNLSSGTQNSKSKGSIDKIESNFFADPGVKGAAKPEPHRTTVLVIEDDITQREVLELVFRSAGYEVVGAENGKNGLDVLKSKPVDLVVCDLMMPVMNGEEVVKEIRNDGRLRHLPVLVLTAAGNAETEFNLLECGADDFCEKNIQRKILLKRAERLLERSKNRASGGKNPLEHFLKD